MHDNFNLTIGAKELILVGGFLAQIIGVWIAVIKFKQHTQEKIESEIGSKADKTETKERFDKMEVQIEIVEKRVNKQHDGLKSDVIREFAEVKDTMKQILEAVLKLKK